MPVFVNNVEITDDQVHSEMQYHPSPTVEDARKEASMDDKLLTIDQLAALDEEKEELIIEALLDDDICQRYYDQNTDRFVDKKSGEALPYKMVKGHIKNYIEDKGHMSVFNAYVDRLMDKANIVELV